MHTNGVLPIVIIILAIVMTIIGLLTSASAKQFYKRVSLKSKLKKISPYIIEDLDLNHLGDVISISKYGVYLIKTINTPGEYFGNDVKGNWTLKTKKSQKNVKNPVKMVINGTEIIKEKYGIKVEPVLIFNFGKTEGVSSKVLTTNKDIINFICKEEILSDEQINEYFTKLSDLKIKKLEK